MLGNAEQLLSKQETIPGVPESPVEGIEDGLETQEELEALGEERLSDAREQSTAAIAEGQTRLEHANDSLGVAPDRLQEIMGATGAGGKLEGVQQQMTSETDELERRLLAFIASITKGEVPAENIEDINKDMDAAEARHEAAMKKRRDDHEERTRQIDDETNRQEAAHAARKEELERQRTGGKTFAEAKKEGEDLVEGIKNKFIKEQAQNKKGTENPLEARTEEERKKNAEMIRQMGETANTVNQEAVSGIQQEQYRICESCRATIGLKDNFCSYCRAKQEKLGYCEQCKTYRKGEFCPTHGCKLL